MPWKLPAAHKLVDALGLNQEWGDLPALLDWKGIQKIHDSHAGLSLDRFLPIEIDNGAVRAYTSKDKTPLLRQIATRANAEMRKEDALWRSWAREYICLSRDVHWCGSRSVSVQPRWRWVVGLGNRSVLRTGITLHHTYGVPYLPGSALKGMTQALEELQLLGDLGAEYNRLGGCERIFGADTEAKTQSAGDVVFMDAVPDPDADCSPRLVVDIMTPHFGEYYGDPEDQAPLEVEDPIPVPFLVVAKGQYIVTVGKRHPEVKQEVVDLAAKLVGRALDELGIGGKTAKGYGYFRLPGDRGER